MTPWRLRFPVTLENRNIHERMGKLLQKEEMSASEDSFEAPYMESGFGKEALSGVGISCVLPYMEDEEAKIRSSI